MSKKYTQLAEDIIKNVGGKDNVRDVRHCVTRLRFHLKDETKADDAAVKSMKGVAALVKAAGEYMVVIGEHVPDVYEEVCKVLGIPGESEARQQENTDGTSQKQFQTTGTFDHHCNSQYDADDNFDKKGRE